MMKSQSLEFVVGYVFGGLDKSIFNHFTKNNCKHALSVSFNVPKIWFGLSCSSSVTNDLTGDVKYRMGEQICSTIKDLYPKYDIMCKKIVPESQYIVFDFHIEREVETKEMTVSEIEKALGYKIKIVGNNNG